MKKTFANLIIVFFCCISAVVCQAEQTASETDLSFEEIFKEEGLINASGKSVPVSTLKGKMVGLYCSASWCGPCRSFTPQLVKFYKQTARKNNLEIIFVSSDKTEEAMMQYMKKDAMPWLAVPFNAAARTVLKKKLRVRGIPNLFIYDSNGKQISPNARWDVVMLGTKAVKAWKSEDYTPKTYQDYINSKNKKKSSRSRRAKK